MDINSGTNRLILEEIKENLSNPRLDINDLNLIRMHLNEDIQNLHCGICGYENFEIISIGMLHYCCKLNQGLTTRSYDEHCLNKPIFPEECPVKKIHFKFEQ